MERERTAQMTEAPGRKGARAMAGPEDGGEEERRNGSVTYDGGAGEAQFEDWDEAW